MKKIGAAIKKFFGINKLFSRCIVVGSLAYMVRVTERVLDITEATGENYYSLIAAAGAVFGGELVLLAFRDMAAKKGSDTVKEIGKKLDTVLNNTIDI